MSESRIGRWANRFALVAGLAIAVGVAGFNLIGADTGATVAAAPAVSDSHGHAEAGHAKGEAAVDDCCAVEGDAHGAENAAAMPADDLLAAAGDDCCATEGHEAETGQIAKQTPVASPILAEEGVEDCCATGEHAAAPQAAKKNNEDSHADHGHDDGHGHAQSAHSGGAWCGEHGVAEAECAICQPHLTASLAPGDSLKLRMASTNAASSAGVEVGKPSAAAPRMSALPGRVAYDETRLAHITALTPGVIVEVVAELGDRVEQGGVLARVSAPGIAEAQESLLAALAEADRAGAAFSRERDLHAREISSAQEVETARADARKAQAAVDSHRQRLISLGMSEESVNEMVSSGKARPDVLLRAPFAGTVVERHAVVGEKAEPGDALFTIADLSRMWVEVDVPASMMASIQEGADARLRPEALDGLVLEGKVDWVAASLNERSRTLPARVVVSNPGGILKNGMYADVELSNGSQLTALHVPADAVQFHEGNPYVFVKQDEDLFDIRRVALGKNHAGRIEVAAGLRADEPLVVAGAHTMKSEFLKSRLGAGCTDH